MATGVPLTPTERKKIVRVAVMVGTVAAAKRFSVSMATIRRALKIENAQPAKSEWREF